MTLFDPYSHTRILDLRQEQLARKARRREQLGIEDPRSLLASAPTTRLVASITRQLIRGRRAIPALPGRPAMDS